jgi:hypothetical protein
MNECALILHDAILARPERSTEREREREREREEKLSAKSDTNAELCLLWMWAERG